MEVAHSFETSKETQHAVWCINPKYHVCVCVCVCVCARARVCDNWRDSLRNLVVNTKVSVVTTDVP